jgi:ABC-type oligopeptide transport system substrate-binding subunit
MAAALLLATAALAACGRGDAPARGPSAASAPSDAAPRILRRGNGPEIDSLDPALAVFAESGNVLRDVYEGLTALDADSRPVPAAADRWEVSADGLTYTFHLRRGMIWSNGDAVTANDFVGSWRRVIDPKTGSPWAQTFDQVVAAREIAAGKAPVDRFGVRAVDDLTLEVKLVAPAPYFPSLVSHWSTLPTHRGAAPGRAGSVVSNGPFLLVESTANVGAKLSRNDRYWNAASVKLDGVVYTQASDPRDELTQFRAGDLDVTATTPLQSSEELQQLVGDRLVTSPSLALYYYGFNTKKAPFKSRELRQALSMSLDRETLTKSVLRMGNPPAYTLVPAGMPDYTPQAPEWASWPYEQRLKRARELYAKAGYSAKNPLKFELRYNVGAGHQRLALAAAAMWKQTLGVEAQPVAEEFKSLLQTIQRGDAQMFRSSWTADYPDAYSFLVSYAEGGSLNLSAYSSEAFNRDLQAAAASADPKARRELLERAEKTFAEDAPIVPIYFLVNRRLVGERVVGWRDNAMRTTYSAGVTLAN